MEAAFLLQKIAEEMGIVFHHEEITVEENRQRNEYLRRYYNPETGEGSDTGDRRILRLPDAPIPVQYIPKALFENEIMAQRESGGVCRTIRSRQNNRYRRSGKKPETRRRRGCHRRTMEGVDTGANSVRFRILGIQLCPYQR